MFTRFGNLRLPSSVITNPNPNPIWLCAIHTYLGVITAEGIPTYVCSCHGATPALLPCHLILDSTLWGSCRQWTHVSGSLTPRYVCIAQSQIGLGLGSHNICPNLNHNLKQLMQKPTDPWRRQNDNIQLVRCLIKCLFACRTEQWTHTGHTALALHEHANFDIHILG